MMAYVRNPGWTEIDDDNVMEILVPALIGKTIVGVVREDDVAIDWATEENTVTLTLDDGIVIEFEGWGHDASGVNARIKFPEDH